MELTKEEKKTFADYITGKNNSKVRKYTIKWEYPQVNIKILLLLIEYLSLHQDMYHLR